MLRIYFIFIFIFFTGSILAEDTCFTIFSFNDTHSIFQKKQYKDLPQIFTLLELEKKQTQNMITLMNGKISAEEDKLDSFSKIIDQMGVDYVCISQGFMQKHLISNREFKSNFQYLAANCLDSNNLPITKTKQVHVYNINGIKIGLFGLIDIPTSAQEDIICISPLFIAKQKVNELKKQGVDVIILVTQLSDMQDRMLAKNIPEIDVIIGCTDKAPISWFEGKTFIHQTSLTEPYITRVDIHIQKKKNPWRCDIEILPTWNLIIDDKVEVNEKIAKAVDEGFK
jgi:2',3'-cyclic-nucleotide 2'-phosphodiesterase (5'-nucleotidase family)